METTEIIFRLLSFLVCFIALYLTVNNRILKEKFGVILTESDLEYFSSKNVFLMLDVIVYDPTSPNVRYYHFTKGKIDADGVFTPENSDTTSGDDYPQICFKLSAWSFNGGINKRSVYGVRYRNINPDGSENYILKKIEVTKPKTSLPYTPSNEIEYHGFEGFRESEFCD